MWWTRRRYTRERGQGTTEYALVAGAIFLIVIVMLQLLGKNTNTSLCGGAKGLGGTICGKYTDYDLAGGAASGPRSMVEGPDGNLWYGEETTNVIGRMDIGGHEILPAFSIPTASAVPHDMILGPDNQVWFTEYGTGRVGRVNTSGHFDEFFTGNAASGPSYLTVGPDGNVWAAMYFTSVIDVFSPATFPAPGSLLHSYSTGVASDPGGLAVSPDKSSIWFLATQGNFIGVMTVATGAVAHQYSTGLTSNAHLEGIVTAPDGNFWFTEWNATNIGKITTAGTITEYPTGTIDNWGIVVGGDGNLWFCARGASEIVEVNLSNDTLKPFPPPNASGGILNIAAAHDHNLWYTDESSGQVGRLY